VVIGDKCALGDNVKIYPNVSIYKGINIGNNVIIHSGTVIGSDGFGFIPKDDKIYKVPQLCGVKIEDDVEIGANVCIDRGAFTDTIIGRGTKLDNLVQIAHNCRIGKNVMIAGQSGIAGSTVIGDNTMMGGNVGISDHAVIGKNVKIAAKSAVKGEVSDGATIMGYPAIDAKEYLQIHALLNILRKKSTLLRSLLRKNPE
jgi:UDP-3-O-[3-hydroxymyristoyl] glucosamine N-acyltransferase